MISFLATTTFSQQITRWRTAPLENKYAFRKTVDTEEDVYVEIIRQRRECVYAHTIIRTIHGQFSMDWNEDLAYEAESWAIYLAAKVGTLQHSNFQFSNGTYYGENLYSLEGPVEPARCHLAIHQWYKYVAKTICVWLSCKINWHQS